MGQHKYMINKQVIALKLNERENIKDIQDSFSELYLRELVPIIEQVLDKYFKADDEVHHQINKIEIDLGSIDIGSVSHQFGKQLDQSLESLRSDNYAAFYLTDEPVNIKKTEVVPQKTPFNILSYYLATGILPWWSPDMTKSFLGEQLDILLQKPALTFIELLTKLHRNENSLNRFLNSFREEQLIKSTYLIAGIAFSEIYNLVDEVEMQVKVSDVKPSVLPSRKEILKAILHNIFSSLPAEQQPPQSFSDLRRYYKSATFESLGINQIKAEDAQLKSVESVKNLVKYYSSINKNIESWQHFFQHLANKASTPAFLSVSDEMLQKLVELLNNLRSESGYKDITSTVKERRQRQFDHLSEEAKNRVNELIRSILSPLAEHIHLIEKEINKNKKLVIKPDSNNESDFNETDFISVSNAGLVLLWPFLPRFFENLGLVKDKVFIDNLARHKAACILQFICTMDQDEIFEGQLPLAKVLCGIPMDEAVTIADVLEKDLEIIDGLLESIISQVTHWKNLSKKGFITSYIERWASLRVRDNHWLLQVQKETYDVLLQKLPWGFNTVTLPWMEKILIVEW